MPGAVSLTLFSAVIILASQASIVSENFAATLGSPLWIAPYVGWCTMFAIVGTGAAAFVDRRGRAALLPRTIGLAALPLLLSVLATTFVLGPALTSSSASNYFADPATWNYLLNIIGWPHRSLPGLFEFNNAAGIANDMLWVVPAVALTLIVALLPVRRAWSFSCLAAALAFGLMWGGDDPVFALAAVAVMSAQGAILISSFRYRAFRGALSLSSLAFLLLVVAFLGQGGRLVAFPALGLIGLLVSLLATRLAQRRLPLAELGGVTAPFIPAALLVSFPVLQAVSSWRSLPNAAAGFAAAVVPVALFAVLLTLASRWILLRMRPSFAGDLQIESPSFVVQRLAASRPKISRPSAPLLLAYLGLVIATIMILAITLFALQRNPWDN